MNRENVDAISAAGQGVAAEAREMPLRYFMRSVVGGMFLFVGVFLSVMTTALLQDFHIGFAKLAGAFVFPVGLALIVLLGGQLYTGAAFTLPVAVLEKKAGAGEMLRVLILCMAGNLVGLFVLSLVLVASGAQGEIMASYLAPLVAGRLAAAPWQTLLRAVLCNFYIAVAVFAGFRLKTEGSKLTLIFFVIAGFVLSGTDHSVANAAYFILHKLYQPDAALLPMVINVALAAIGNFIGGAVLSALPIWYVGKKS